MRITCGLCVVAASVTASEIWMAWNHEFQAPFHYLHCRNSERWMACHHEFQSVQLDGVMDGRQVRCTTGAAVGLVRRPAFRKHVQIQLNFIIVFCAS